VLSWAATACGAPQATGTRVVMPSYLFGTLGTHSLDLRGLCPGRPTEITFASTPRTVAISLLTLGIYTPHQLSVSCGPVMTRNARVRRR
jgi:hypothetical protein